MKKWILLAALACCTGTLHAQTSTSHAQTELTQEETAARIAELARTDNRAMHHLDILCNRFGGRPVGSDAYENAQAWAASCFREWGYEVRLEVAGVMGCGFNRDGWWGRMTGEENAVLHFATPSYSVGTHGVQRGPVLIEPRTQAEFDRMRTALKGSWVLVNGQSRGWALLHGEKARRQRQAILARNDSLRAELRKGRAKKEKIERIDEETPALFYDEMVKAGVLGFIQAAPVPITALYDREVVLRKLGFDSLPAVPDIKLDREQYDRIRRMVGERRFVELEFDIRNHFKMGPVPFHNLVAALRGTKYPDEYVVVGAHLDAFDVATGGVDCGSGTAVVMEAARLLSAAGARPDRTILFILFAGEEFGLWGSQAWIEQHADLLPKISNMFNRDGGPMPYVGFRAPASLLEEYRPTVEAIRRLYPDYPFELTRLEPRAVPTRTGGNDASSFAVKAVPTVQMTERDTKGCNFDYREIWHTERDTYTKSIPEYQQQAAAVMALMVLQTANLPTPFPRDEVYLRK